MRNRARQDNVRGDREAVIVGAILGGMIVTGLCGVRWAQAHGQRVSNALEAVKRQREGAAPLTAEDPLWQIVGLGRTTGPTDLSEHVDERLVESYRAKMQPNR